MTDVKALVDDAISKHFITVYSKSYCPYCKATKKLLQSLDLTDEQKPYIVELDQVDDGAEQQDYLQQKSGQRTVPNVFIGQKHIGGNSDLQALNASGELQKIIKDDEMSALETLDGVSLLATHALDRARQTDELSYSSGISLLTVKNDLLLSYLQHLLVVLAIQLSPDHALKDHSQVVMEGVKARIALEKIRPLQSKLKYQIEKLLSKAQEAEAGQLANDDDIANDPLSFRPNPEALVSARAPQDADSDASEHDASASKDGIYRPPRVAAMPYDEPNKKGKKHRERPERLLAEMASALHDKTPYAEASTGLSVAPSFSSKKAHKVNEMIAYEEEHMHRISMSKRESKKRRQDEEDVYGGEATTNQRGRKSGGFEQEFGDLLQGMGRDGKRFDAMRQMTRPLPDGTNSAPNKRKQQSSKGQFDEAIKKQKKRRKQ